jgi:hypothetical protein
MTAPTSTVVRRRAGVRVPLGRTARRAVLAVHLWSAGAWVGLDVALAALVVTALRADDAPRRAAVFQVLEVVAVWPLALAGLVCLGSGVVLGLATKYGLVRFWWVLIKLIINVLLSTLVLLLLRPNAHALADSGRRLAAGQPVDVDLSSLVMPPAVTMVALTVAVYLSVYKPWGRTRDTPS